MISKTGRRFSSLAWGLRLDNCQAHKLKVHQESEHLDFTYCTYWNGFSHYALYTDQATGGLTSPLNYRDMSNQSTHKMFESESDYVTGCLDQFREKIGHTQQPYFEKRTENTLKVGSEGSLYCHVP